MARPCWAWSRMVRQRRRQASRSMAAVGSSMTSRSGLPTRAIAKRSLLGLAAREASVRRLSKPSSWATVTTCGDGEWMGIEAGQHVEQFRHRHTGHQPSVMKHGAHQARGHRAVGWPSEQFDGAVVGYEHAEQERDGSRLGGPIGSKESHRFAFGDHEAEVLDGANGTERPGDAGPGHRGGTGNRRQVHRSTSTNGAVTSWPSAQ